MGFLNFLGGAVKVLAGGAVFLLCMFLASALMAGGEMLLAVIAFVIAMVGGLYAQYHRGRQPQRIR